MVRLVVVSLALRALLVSAFALACDGNKPKNPGERAVQAAPTNPVLLFIAPDQSNRARLFALGPTGNDSRSVAATDDLDVLTAVVSRSGTAIAIVAADENGKKRLYRGNLDAKLRLEPVQTDAPLSDVRAVSDDGQTIVLESASGLSVLRRASSTPIALSDRLMYRVALSADGSKLAYSTMKSSCAADFAKMSRCPVSLFGVDIAEGGTPRVLAGDPQSVAYDPEFRNATGSELLYMTTEGDSSDRCRDHVNDCQYSIRSMTWSGGNDRVVIESGVLAREAADGTIAHRTLAGGWSKQSLVIGGRAIEGWLTHRTHHWSPNSRWIALQRRRDGESFLDVIDHRGERSRDGVPGMDSRIVGWSAAPVPTGSLTLAEPRAVRQLRRAVSLARSRGTATTPIALMKGQAYARERVVPDSVQLSTSNEAAKWFDNNRDGIVIAPLFDYCRIRALNPAVKALVSLDRDHILLQHSTKQPVRIRHGKPTASFKIPDGPVIDLIGFELPRTAALSSRIPLQLSWRASTPPGYAWKVFVHFDGASQRFQADHAPPLCVQDWDDRIAGYEIDVEVAQPFGALRPGTYQVYLGWFKGSTRAGDRVQVGTIEITL